MENNLIRSLIRTIGVLVDKLLRVRGKLGRRGVETLHDVSATLQAALLD